jgi:hypothetical protein
MRITEHKRMYYAKQTDYAKKDVPLLSRRGYADKKSPRSLSRSAGPWPWGFQV